MSTKDPMLAATPDASRVLFDTFSQNASGFLREDVLAAAVNLLINAIRQTAKTRPEAERIFDEMFGTTKQMLVNHYDTLGRKRGVFPYDQTITVPFLEFQNKF